MIVTILSKIVVLLNSEQNIVKLTSSTSFRTETAVKSGMMTWRASFFILRREVKSILSDDMRGISNIVLRPCFSGSFVDSNLCG